VAAEPPPGVVAAGEAPASGPAPEGGEGTHKRRRRRGGRGRRREGGEGAAPQAQAPAESRAPHGERKPPRERSAASPSRPSRQVAVQSGMNEPAKKPGFFRRLTRLFTGR
jgi:ATP-dependent RNA helicase RhlB